MILPSTRRGGEAPPLRALPCYDPRVRRAASLPLAFWALALLVVAFAAWCGWAIVTTQSVRTDIEANVNALSALQEVRTRLDRLGAEPASSASPDEWSALAGKLGVVSEAAARAGVPADLAPVARSLEAQLARVERASAADGHAARQALFQGMDRLTTGLRRHSRDLSVKIAGHLDRLNAITAAAFVFAAASLFLLALAHRRRLRAEQSERALAHHHTMLHAAASRWASGDLSTALSPGEAGDLSIERALEEVRRSLVAKLAEIASLNEALYHQIRERSAQLADALARVDGKGSAAVVHKEKGALFIGRYEILDRLGEGGMGTVFRVRRVTDGQLFALKILHVTGSDLAQARFLREARLLTEIRHPNVVVIHDVGASPEGELYLVTELIEGKSLDEETPWKRPEDAGSVLAAVAAGLAAVHARGIIHRDLKPANVVVAPGKEGGPRVVKLIDFGIARSVEPDEPPPPPLPLPRFTPIPAPDVANPRIAAESPSPSAATTPGGTPAASPSASTQHGMLVGTPRFIAPEVALSGGRVTAAADVFAFGVTAYRVLTGEMPFRESPATLVLLGASLPAPVPLARRCPSLPAVVAELVMRCLAEDPATRPTAEELASGLSGS